MKNKSPVKNRAKNSLCPNYNKTPSIPKRLLAQEGVRFTKLRKNSKIPVESNHLKKNYLTKAIQEHINRGNNYGIIGGHGGIIIIDADHSDVENAISTKLPETFTVKTPDKGYHYYYYCPEMEDEPKVQLQIDKENAGHIMTKGGYVVGANCIHPDTGTAYKMDKNIHIAEISKELLYSALIPFIKPKNENFVSVPDNFGFSIQDVLQEYGVSLSKSGSSLSGEHPVHGSTNGRNFCVDISKNVWHCFRCQSGGGVLQLIALLEDILECEECQKGALTGSKFKTAARIAEEKFKVKILNSAIGELLDDEQLEILHEKIQEIDCDTPKPKIPNLLEPVLDELSKIDIAQAEGIIQEQIKQHFNFTNLQLKPYLEKLKRKRKKYESKNITETTLTIDDARSYLKADKFETKVHPSIDFKAGMMYFGIKVRGQVFLVSSGSNDLIQPL